MKEHTKPNGNSDLKSFKQLLESGEECLQERKFNFPAGKSPPVRVGMRGGHCLFSVLPIK